MRAQAWFGGLVVALGTGAAHAQELPASSPTGAPAAAASSPSGAPASSVAPPGEPAAVVTPQALDPAQPGGVLAGEDQSNTPAVYAPDGTPLVPQKQPVRWTEDGSWGWFVVGGGVLAGAGLTGMGLAHTCEESGKNSCSSWVSMAIWGGIGLAALGTVIGLTVVERGHARTRNQNFGTLKLGALGEFRFAPAPAPPSH